MSEPALKAVSVSAALTEALRQRILGGDITPGTPLPEPELAATYGVARPTVRAALQELVGMGLLRREANRSAYVPELSGDDVRDVFLVRRSLECDAVRTLVEQRARPPRAEQAVRKLESFRKNVEWSAIVDSDLEFHRALIEAVGSSRLVRLYAMLLDEIRLSLAQLRPAYESPAALAAEHRALLEAIAAGDRAAAISLLDDHLAQAVAALTSGDGE